MASLMSKLWRIGSARSPILSSALPSRINPPGFSFRTTPTSLITLARVPALIQPIYQQWTAYASGPSSKNKDHAKKGGPNRNSSETTRRIPKHAIVHGTFTFGNVLIAVADSRGNVQTFASAGLEVLAIKSSARSTKYAAYATAEYAARAARQLGIISAEVRMKGGGNVGKRKDFLRGLAAGGLSITRIRDVTPLPHNGCRPPKQRRV